jgi:plasmid stabilization system protein ParE
MAARKWRVRLGAVAELDLANILKWTADKFGAQQARVYRHTLWQAIGELESDPKQGGQRHATRSCQDYVRSMLPGTDDAVAIFYCIEHTKLRSSKSSESFTIRWN